MRNPLFFALTFLFALLFAGCSGGGGSAPASISPPGDDTGGDTDDGDIGNWDDDDEIGISIQLTASTLYPRVDEDVRMTAEVTIPAGAEVVDTWWEVGTDNAEFVHITSQTDTAADLIFAQEGEYRIHLYVDWTFEGETKQAWGNETLTVRPPPEVINDG